MRAVLLCLIASTSVADTFPVRPSDEVLDRAAMLDAVIGATHEFFDGGRSFFSVSGSYSYTYPDGGIAYGTWDLPAAGEDGVICTAFRHGFSRCDRYVANKGQLVLITETGDRFPVRAATGKGN